MKLLRHLTAIVSFPFSTTARRQAISFIRAFTLCLAITATAFSAPRQAVDPQTIKDKVSIALGQELHVRFKLDGDRLLQPEAVKKSGGSGAGVTIQLKTTDSTPFPVRGVATRPFLAVSNNFERALHCRALARLKGSKEFFEISDLAVIEPAGRGEMLAVRCWESGSLVEEVILYQFALSPRPAK